MEEKYFLQGSNNLKCRIEVQNLTYECCFEDKMIFKMILGVPEIMLAQSPYSSLQFSMKKDLFENSTSPIQTSR